VQREDNCAATFQLWCSFCHAGRCIFSNIWCHNRVFVGWVSQRLTCLVERKEVF